MDGDGYLVAPAGESLVDGVVHNLVNEVVKSGFRGRAYVHTRTLSHRFETFQNLNLAFVVFVRRAVNLGVVCAYVLKVDVFKHNVLGFVCVFLDCVLIERIGCKVFVCGLLVHVELLFFVVRQFIITFLSRK